MISIPLSQGRFALIDEADEDLAAVKWYAHKRSNTFYAMRTERINGKRFTGYLHRAIAARIGITGPVDHRNRDGLDNTRGNLRPATPSQNGANRAIEPANKSGYKGVSWCKRDRKWLAQIKVENRAFNLGLFETPEDAARVYDAKAREAFGEFARVNFPEAA